MKHFRINKKLGVSGLALAVAMVAGGAAYAYFTSPGTGSGSEQTGSASDLTIQQVGSPIYDSGVVPGTWEYSQALNGPEIWGLGNEVTLDNSAAGGALDNAVVGMVNFAGTAFTTSVTLNVFAPSDLSNPLTSDTENISVPYCGSITSAWDGSFYCSAHGHAEFDATFGNFSPTVTLPNTVVYEVVLNELNSDCATECGNNSSPVGSLNVALSDSSAPEPTVGSDTTGVLWYDSTNLTALASDIGAGPASSLTSGTFGPAANQEGLNGQPEGIGDVFAIQLNADSGDLYPGGPAQDISYSITNPGSGSVHVSSVTVSVATDPNNGFVESVPGETWTDVSNCYAGWYTINNSSLNVNTDLAGNSTTTFSPALQSNLTGYVTSIQMTNPDQSQDACEGAVVGLVFSSD